MVNIYFKPYSNRRLEKIFFDYLKCTASESNHIEKSFELPNELLNRLITTSEILSSIEACNYISPKKKELSKLYLLNLPHKLKVAKDISELSVDFVLESRNHLTFIEFHEKQHHRLSDKRLKPIYSPNDERFAIPRFLQRLIKDIWRWKNLTNYKIVWYDWFDKNNSISLNIAKETNEEFVLPNKFSISLL